MPKRPQGRPAPRAVPERPRSAAHFGLNLLALAGGLGVILALIRWPGGFDAVLAALPWNGGKLGSDVLPVALTGCCVVFLVIALGEMLRRPAWGRPSSGLVLRALRKPDPGRVGLRLLGLAGTLGIVAFVYWLFPEYHGSFYNPYWDFLRTLAVVALPLAPFYFLWTDAHMEQPQDSYWHLGRMLLSDWKDLDRAALRAHFMGWTVKCYFLPLMVVYLSGEVHTLGNVYHALSTDSMALYHFFYELSYTVDLLFCVVGYTVTLRLFDSHIRSTEPTAFGWLIALLCYQPFYSVIGNMYLRYDDSIYWDNWLAGLPWLRELWAAVIILLLFAYGLSTVAFGLRFSNLTYRGIITSGPYRFSKHPAYLSKNLSWWLISVPWISTESGFEALRNCCLLGILNLVYYLRARTEENHLSLRDPDYVAYALWMEEHGLLRQLGRWLPVLRYKPPASAAEATAPVAAGR